MTPLNKAVNFLINIPAKKITNATAYLALECQQQARTLQVIFPAALTLHALASLPKSLAQLPGVTKQIISLTKLLNKQSSPSSSFNYWIRNSPSSKRSPLPDDIDDSALCLSALLSSGYKVSPQYFLKIIRLETSPGGPYKTWYVERQHDQKQLWQDVDPVVNANLLYAAARMGINLSRTETYLLQRLRSRKVNSPYYPYDLTFHFYLARYAHAKQDAGIKRLLTASLKQMSANKLSPMETMLWALAWSYCANKVAPGMIKQISSWQTATGALPSLPLCHDFAQGSKHTYAASPVISTALFLELLAINAPAEARLPDASLIKISSSVKAQQQTIARELKQDPLGSKILELFPLQNSYRALTVPVGTALDLQPALSKAQQQNINQLSLAMFYGWLAYTLYDDVLDAQRKTTLLPIANSLLRRSLEQLYALSAEFPSVVSSISKSFLTVEAHYLWESQHTAFQQNGAIPQLSENWTPGYIPLRMNAYIEAMSQLPLLLGEVNHKLTAALRKFFSAQIIIDQLNDDCHDWEEDLHAGNMTFVLWQLLRDAGKSKNLKRVFFATTLSKITGIAKKKYQEGCRALKAINPQSDFLQHLLDKTWKPLETAEQEREKTLKLLTYLKK